MTAEGRAAALRAEVATHKAAIRRHRAALADAKARLVQLERELASRGIRLVVETETGEGENPWPSRSCRSTS